MRNMTYSFTQQLARHDPGLVYTLLPGDHSYRLTSYPYYTKLQHLGDPTAFRSIDHNIESMAAGRGVRQIQGSLYLDDEYADDIAEIVPGMHRHLLDCCSTVHQRGLASHRYIQAVGGDTLTEDNLAKYKTRRVSVPCKASEIRATHPRIPHGAWDSPYGLEGQSCRGTLLKMRTVTWKSRKLAGVRSSRTPTPPLRRRRVRHQATQTCMGRWTHHSL
ncbi:hypothetical protein M433DRAFT_192349 [Acidomyces richmondensis BFW]|nr:hypothetical protein M433DRAFT_192349 [Acidomyces richmondensis BFW]